MINVTRSSMPKYEEYCEEIKDLWETRWLTNMGAKHRLLQSQLKAYLDVDNIELMVNGHMALEMVLQAMNIQGEVITTPFTFASTTHAIIRNNLKPVFCDVNADDFTIDVNKIESLITDRTSAIMPVHVYGHVCDVEAIDEIAKKYGLKVIYDAAHTFGVKYKGHGIANYGDASCYSFHATKVYNTIEGGAVCFRKQELGKRLCQLRDFGIKDEETIDGVGANAKMSEFSAAMGICNLRHIDSEIEKRRKVVLKYREMLDGVSGIKLSPSQRDVLPNYAYFPIVIDERLFGTTRNVVQEKLKECGYAARKYFYPLTNMFDCFHGKYDVTETLVALSISKRVLTLPLYADLPLADVEKIAMIVRSMKQ